GLDVTGAGRERDRYGDGHALLRRGLRGREGTDALQVPRGRGAVEMSRRGLSGAIQGDGHDASSPGAALSSAADGGPGIPGDQRLCGGSEGCAPGGTWNTRLSAGSCQPTPEVSRALRGSADAASSASSASSSASWRGPPGGWSPGARRSMSCQTACIPVLRRARMCSQFETQQVTAP